MRKAFLNTSVKIVAFVRNAFVFRKIEFLHLICKDIFEIFRKQHLCEVEVDEETLSRSWVGAYLDDRKVGII